MNGRVVVTGIGVLTPIGNGVSDFWKSLVSGKSGIGPITRFDTAESAVKIAGEVKDVDFTQYAPAKALKRMARTSKLAVAAAGMALVNAGLCGEALGGDADVYLGVACPDLLTIEQTIETRMAKGERFINPFGAAAAVTAAPAGNVSVELGISGEVMTFSTGCSSSTNAIGQALRRIRSGASRLILAGGADVGVQRDLVASYARARALSTRNDSPEEASRPFEANRDGQVLSEAAGILILEEYTHAKARNAKIYAELVGYGTSSDAFSMFQVSTDPGPGSECLGRALADARLDQGHVGYYCAHGSSSLRTDARETNMLKGAFKRDAYRIPVSSIKSMLGHPFGASGVLQAATCALALSEGALPPTINYEEPDPECDLDYIPNEARDENPHAALTYALGVGGNNAALALKAL